MKERLRRTFFGTAGVIIEDLPEYGEDTSETSLQNNVVSLFVFGVCENFLMIFFAGAMFGVADALWC